ncbi:hypothetical protein GNY06_04450 [Elizabethkingia argentiflava]|uniref:Uncharacterized protein n=1 Tax=Elizabethkingia argenteiflava TaxID=2681556 RepID=A0A845PSN2_9FLAO|nr:hypothetical protein [Elizabethkingia argenteiflava]
MSQDRIGLQGGLNTYAYVKAPNSWVDIFGLSTAYDVDTYKNLKVRNWS